VGATALNGTKVSKSDFNTISKAVMTSGLEKLEAEAG
jgi:hypothetical protein